MSSPKLRVIFRPNAEIQTFFRPKSGGLQKKKVFTKIESDFSAGFVRFGVVEGDASLAGAELFEIEADFSAKIVTFRLVGGDASSGGFRGGDGGMHPPHQPKSNDFGRKISLYFE